MDSSEPEKSKTSQLVSFKRKTRPFKDVMDSITPELLFEGTRFDGGKAVSIPAYAFDANNPQDVDWGGVWYGNRVVPLTPDLLRHSESFDRDFEGLYEPEIEEYLIEQNRPKGPTSASDV